MSIVTSADSAPARSGSTRPSRSSAWACTSPSPDSTAAHCPSQNLRARPAAVVEPSPGTGVNPCPATSARCRSNPTRKSSPHNCAAAIPTSTCPAVNPRSRDLIGRPRRQSGRPHRAAQTAPTPRPAPKTWSAIRPARPPAPAPGGLVACVLCRVAPARCRAEAPSEPGLRAFPAPRLKQAPRASQVCSVLVLLVVARLMHEAWVRRSRTPSGVSAP